MRRPANPLLARFPPRATKSSSLVALSGQAGGEDSLFGYLILVSIGLVLFLIPDARIMLAFVWCFAVLLVVAMDAVRFGRWRQEYESSIGRVIRSRRKRK